ncbi:hypothetical protein ElyMa_002985800 [Elysia marginata]|uniref:Uncharacterized protein n=1 Tax=Elysia marginata TaxID=1093978 RepID=A0AAV4IAM0_9GAST|nr:hypothetical protein ElyMa_002985800 [Elysia marginata]
MRVTANVTACGQKRLVCSSQTLRQVSPGCREDPDSQQSDSIRLEDVRMPIRRTPNQNSKGGLKPRQQQRWTEPISQLSRKTGPVVGDLRT